jgi:hypothetical protein
MTTPTEKVKLPVSQFVCELKQWISGKDSEYIQEPFYKAASARVGADGRPEMGDLDLTQTVVATHRTLESFIVTLDGSNEKILARTLDLPEKDYTFLIDKINEIRKKN